MVRDQPKIRNNNAIPSGNSFLIAVTKVIEENINNDQFSVEELAREMSMSRFQIYRKLHFLTGLSISRFIRELRLKRASQLLMESNDTASEVAYKVGFNSPAYFNACFTKHYGITPGEFRKSRYWNDVDGFEGRNNRQAPISNGENILKKLHFSFNKKYLLAAISVIVVFVALFNILRLFPEPNYHLLDNTSLTAVFPEKSIAVMNFRNQSGEQENQYLAEGIKESLISHLSGIHDLRVSPHNTLELYRDSEKSILEVGKELGVTYVLKGNIQKWEDKVDIQVIIIEIRSGLQILSRHYTASDKKIFILLTEIAQDVTEELALTLLPEEEKMLASQPTTDPMAYNFYMRGRLFFANYLSKYDKKDLDRAAAMYKEALTIDPEFALAYVGLGEIHGSRHHYFGWESNGAPAYADSMMMFASKALEIDPDLWRAYALRGTYYENMNQIDLAILDQERAIKLNPNSVETYLNLGRIWYLYKNNPIRTYKYLMKAKFYEREGDLLPNIIWHLGVFFMSIEDFQRSEKCFRECIRLNPGNPGWYGALSWLYWTYGKFKVAMAIEQDSIGNEGVFPLLHANLGEYDRVLGEMNVPDEIDEDFINNLEEPFEINEAYVYRKMVNDSIGILMMEHLLSTNEKSHAYKKDYEMNPWGLAEINAAMGRYELAKNYIIKLEKESPYSHWFTFLPHHHIFRELRDDPEILAILDRVRQRKAVIRERIKEIEKNGSGTVLSSINSL